MQTVEILSANPAVTLKFSDFDGNYLVVSFDSPTIQIAVRVYASKDSGLGDMAALVDLFKTMNDNWKGWGGELSWVSLDGEFGIVATADSSGHVSLRLKFQEISGPAPCSADIDFTLEAMQVEQAHRKLAHLFLRE